MRSLKIMILLFVVTGLVSACEAKDTKTAQNAPGYGAPGYETPAPEYGAPGYGAPEKKAPAPSYGDGNAQRGKALFNDPKFGNGTSGKSCNSCHPGGRGLEAAGEKTEFNIMGRKQNSIEEAVNICIEIPLKGTPIDPNSQDMKDMVAYLKSL